MMKTEKPTKSDADVNATDVGLMERRIASRETLAAADFM